MKAKILVPSALLFILAAGQVNAQAPEGATGIPAPMAPGNPNMSTVVPPPGEPNNPAGAPNNPADTMISPSTGANMNTGASPGTLNSMTPSSGNANAAAPKTPAGANNILANAPPHMDFSQFTTYLRQQLGITGNAPVTEAQWDAINPDLFGGNKPSFSSLDKDHDGTLDRKDLNPVYSSLYQQYQSQK